jgi:hypothetical protein
MIGLDAPVTINGILYSAIVCWYEDVTALEYPPTSMSTLSSVISLVAAFWPPCWVDSSSPTISLIWAFDPSLKVTPPSALIFSAATWADCHMLLPTLLAGPVSDAITPILITPGTAVVGCCACCVHPAKNAAKRRITMKITGNFMICSFYAML